MLYAAKPSATGQADITVLGAGTLFKGEVDVGTGGLWAEGTVEGTIASEGTVTVSPAGLVRGTIMARRLVVTGRVEGTFQVTGCLEIHSSGWVEGEVQTGALVVDEGSTLQGRCGRLAQPVRNVAERPPVAALPTPPGPAWPGTRSDRAVGRGTGRPVLGAVLGVLAGITLLLAGSFAYLRHRRTADPAPVLAEPAPASAAPVSATPPATVPGGPAPARKPAPDPASAGPGLKSTAEPVAAPPAPPRPEPAPAASRTQTKAAPQEVPTSAPAPAPAPAKEEQPEASEP